MADVEQQKVIVFVIGVIVALGSVWLMVRFRRGHAPRLHRVVERWKPIVRELAARGVDDPALLAGALANWDLRLDPPEVVPARLPHAVASVADALEVALPTVQKAIVARSSEPERYLEDLRALRPRLDGLPGVREIGGLWPEEPAMMKRALDAYVQRSGLR